MSNQFGLDLKSVENIVFNVKFLELIQNQLYNQNHEHDGAITAITIIIMYIYALKVDIENETLSYQHFIVEGITESSVCKMLKARSRMILCHDF